MNWRGRPLETLEVIVNLIGSTTNRSGLKVECSLDEMEYEKGIRVTDEEMSDVNLFRDSWRGDWNYRIIPHQSIIYFVSGPKGDRLKITHGFDVTSPPAAL